MLLSSFVHGKYRFTTPLVSSLKVCAGTVAEILPPEVVIRVLKPLIQMGDYPVNQSAIKMLNKLIEAHPPAIVAQALSDIMPGLVKVRYLSLALWPCYLQSWA